MKKNNLDDLFDSAKFSDEQPSASVTEKTPSGDVWQSADFQDTPSPTQKTPVQKNQSALEEIEPYFRGAANEASIIPAGGLELLKQGRNYLHEGANAISPSLGKIITKTNIDPMNFFGVPKTPFNTAATQFAAAAFPAAIGVEGPAISEAAGVLPKIANILSKYAAPNALLGATLDPTNRTAGAAIGAGAGSIIPSISSSLEGIGNKGANFISELQSPNKWMNNSLQKLVSSHLGNQKAGQELYSVAKQAGDYSGIPGTDVAETDLGDQFTKQFGKTAAGKFASENPGFFANNYSDIEGLNKKEIPDWRHPIIGKNLSSQIDSRLEAPTNVGSKDNPLDVTKSWQELKQNPNMETALTAKHALESAAKSNLFEVSEKTAFKDAASKINDNMIIPGLKNYDSINGTNLTGKYISANVPYSKYLENQNISKGIGKLLSGKSAPGTAQDVYKLLSKASKNGNMPANSDLSDFYMQLGDKLQARKDVPKWVYGLGHIVSGVPKVAARQINKLNPFLMGSALSQVQGKYNKK